MNEISVTQPIRATSFNPAARLGAKPQEPSIQVRQLNHYYGSGDLRKQVLFDNNLTVYPGEIIIMTGPSGSGKTTLLTLIGTLRSVQEGELWLLNQPLHQASDRQRMEMRRQIGFIFQAHNLFESLSATQNVRMSLELVEPSGNRRDQTMRCKEMLEAVGLGQRTGHKPKQLSGGQKQRVAIARGLVHNPRLVLADEPTAALDEHSGRTVVELLRKRAKEDGTTVIMVTHDNRILDVADRIVNMIDGHIRSDVMVREASLIGEMLAKCSVFEGLSPRSLTEMADQMIAEVFAPGDRIIQEGAPGDRFYVVRDGRVAVKKGTREEVVAELHQGDFFGEAALLTGQPRNASIDAITETVLYSLSEPDFQKAMQARRSLENEVRSSLFDR